MKTLLTLALLLTTAVASAEPKAPKPVLCLNYQLTRLTIDGTDQKVAICSDTKVAVILLRPIALTLIDPSEQMHGAVIGWRQ